MFYPYYKSLKDRITGQVSDVKDIQKYNDQYSGSNLTPCNVLIEFPTFVPTPYVSKTTRKLTSVDICLHLVSKIISDKDGYVPDDQYKAHDEVGDDIITAVNEHQLVYLAENLGRPLQVTGYHEAVKVKGWLVTKIFLKTKE
jgi:hypothetical protein